MDCLSIQNAFVISWFSTIPSFSIINFIKLSLKLWQLHSVIQVRDKFSFKRLLVSEELGVVVQSSKFTKYAEHEKPARSEGL